MELRFQGKYKSLTDFEWTNIANFVVLTGPNGSGKSQLLDLIHNTIINKTNTSERISISDINIKSSEVTYLKGEWQLQNTSHVSLSTIQQNMNAHYQNFKNGSYRQSHEGNLKIFNACQEIIRITGKQPNQVTVEEFEEYFPEILFEQESEISQKIGEIFYNYRLSEIELQAEGKNEETIKKP